MAKKKKKAPPKENKCQSCGTPCGDADYCAPCARVEFPQFYAEPWEDDFDPMMDFRDD